MMLRQPTGIRARERLRAPRIAGRAWFVDDSDRIAFLSSYLAAMHEAIRLGCEVRGWFLWTLLDGFEWIDGFEKRFGLVRVEPETLRRVPKASFPFVRGVFGANDL